MNDVEFSYKAISELSEATEDVQQESIGMDELGDLDDYDMLLTATKKKMLIVSPSRN